VFGWTVVFGKAVVSCGLWKSCYEKTVVGKVEDHLIRATVSCGKLYGWNMVRAAVSCGKLYGWNTCNISEGSWYYLYTKYSYKPNMFTISHVNIFFGKKNIKFSKFFIYLVHINTTVAITQDKGLIKLWYIST
jgi:hypothetical protein